MTSLPRPALATIEDPGFETFKTKVRQLTGLDLNAYKHKQMYRRLKSLRGRQGAGSWTAFYRLLADSPEALGEFRDFVTINVSELFRNADKFLQLRDEILPELAAGKSGLRVWSAGCSYGAEPYTLAMILDSKLGGQRHSILASDIDRTILGRAVSGRGFSDDDIEQVPPEMKDRYLEPAGPDEWAVKPRLKALITFKRHDLLRDPYPQRMDLIVCRNVVIYFTEEAKSRIYRQFREALRPGGFLFVGGTELVPKANELGFVSRMISFYQRPPLTQTQAAR